MDACIQHSFTFSSRFLLSFSDRKNGFVYFELLSLVTSIGYVLFPYFFSRKLQCLAQAKQYLLSDQILSLRKYNTKCIYL